MAAFKYFSVAVWLCFCINAYLALPSYHFRAGLTTGSILTSDLDLEFLGLGISTILALDLVIGEESFVSPFAVATNSCSISIANQLDSTFTSPMVVVMVGEEAVDVTRCTAIKRLSTSTAKQGAETRPI